MALPFHLQKLPPESLDILRYLSKIASATPEAIESGTGLSSRTVGKAIRRLVNYDLIEITGGAYQLTTDGKIAAKQIAEYDATMANAAPDRPRSVPKAQRHLSVVMPRSFSAGRPTDLYFGVNPPSPDGYRLTEAANVELRVSAVGGTLSLNNVSLSIPPDKAATPGKVSLTPDPAGQMVRVRVDAFQTLGLAELEALGGMYFDVRVNQDSGFQDSTLRAVGMDLLLAPPR